MSENTLLYALYSLGYRGQMTGHGFKGLASTIFHEVTLHFREEWIEMQLAHKDNDKTRAAYNHAKYLPQRIVMLRWYNEYLSELRKGKYIEPLAYASLNKPAFEMQAAA